LVFSATSVKLLNLAGAIGVCPVSLRSWSSDSLSANLSIPQSV